MQGNALAHADRERRLQKVGFLVFNDTYGTGLRNDDREELQGHRWRVHLRLQGSTATSSRPVQTTFSSEVSAVLATNPDAIMILAFDETKAIVPELVAQGWDMSKSYLSDGNTADYSEDLPRAASTGAQGTIPGADATRRVQGPQLERLGHAGQRRGPVRLLLRG